MISVNLEPNSGETFCTVRAAADSAHSVVRFTFASYDITFSRGWNLIVDANRIFVVAAQQYRGASDIIISTLENFCPPALLHSADAECRAQVYKMLGLTGELARDG